MIKTPTLIFGKLKSWFIELHIDKISPFLIRQKNNSEPDITFSAFVERKSSGDNTNTSGHKRDARQDLFSITQGTRFVSETTESLMFEKNNRRPDVQR